MKLLHRFHTLVRDALARNTSDGLERSAFLMLLAYLLAGPFLSGTVLPAPIAGDAPAPMGSLLINLFAFLTAAAALLSRSATRSLRPLMLPLGAVGTLTLLGVVQLLPLPEGVMRQIASVNLKIYHETSEITALFGRSGVVRPRISIAPTETATATLEILACLALFLAAAALLRSRVRQRVFTWAVLAAALLHVAWLAAAGRGTDDSLPGVLLEKPERLAAYFGIALFVAFGNFWAAVLTNADRGLDAADSAERYERRFLPIAARAAVWIGIAIGIALTHSKAALVAAAATTLTVLALAFARRRRDLARPILGSMAVALAAAFPIAARIEAATPGSSAAVAANPPIWQISLAAWRQFPILGSGLGSFPEAFRRVQPRELKGLVENAHSDPLQLLVTGGAGGLAIAILLLGSLLALLFSAWRTQKHREESAIVLGGLGALLFVALQGVFDFNLSPSVIPTTLAAVLGAAWAAAQARGSEAR